jgi:hypothetical protein
MTQDLLTFEVKILICLIDKEKFMKTTPKHNLTIGLPILFYTWCCVYFRSKKKIQQIDVNKKSFQTRIYDIFVNISCFELKGIP